MGRMKRILCYASPLAALTALSLLFVFRHKQDSFGTRASSIRTADYVEQSAPAQEPFEGDTAREFRGQADIPNVGSQSAFDITPRNASISHAGNSYQATFEPERATISLSRRIPGLSRTALSYRLDEIRVGERLLCTASAAPPQYSGKSVWYDRGVVEERYTLRRNDVEQDFIIRDLPEGPGEITVTGTISTQLTAPTNGTKASKLSFTHRGGEVIRVSDAVAVDAAGKRLELSLEYSSSKMTMTVPAEWVAEASLPIVIDPVIGSPFEIDPALTAVAGERQCDVAYSSTSNEWFVVWSEETSPAGTYDIRGRRISATGTLLGSELLIASPFNQGADVTVSWASSVNRYLVAWGWVQGRIVNADGTFFNSEFTIDNRATAGSSTSNHATAAFDGTNWYVCYSSWDGVTTRDNIRGRFVSTSGVPGAAADPDMEADDANHPTVAFTNGTYLVAWDKGFRPAARTMTTSGTFPTAISLYNGGSTDTQPQTDCSGGNGRFLITWRHNPGTSLEVRGIRVDTSLVTVGSQTTIDTMPVSSVGARSIFNPTNAEWFVVWVESNDLYGRRYAFDGTFPASVERLTTTAAFAFEPELAWNSSANEVLIAYTDSSPSKVWGLRYGFPAPPGPPAPANFTGTAQSTTSILWQWNDVTGETGYEVHDAGHFVKASTSANVLSVTENSLTENAPTSRHVHALPGPSAPSNTATIYTLVHTPVGSDFALTVVSTTQIDIVVTAPPNSASGSTACEIQRSPNGTDWSAPPIKAFTDAGYTKNDTGLSPSTIYYYRFRYRNGDGLVTDYSPTKNATTFSPLPAPTGLSATALNSRVSLAWNAVPGATSYIVKRSNTTGGPYRNIYPCTTNSYLDEEVENQVAYFYVVSAVNSGGESPNSSQVSATPAAPAINALFVVGNTSLSVSDNAIKTRLENLGYTLTIKKDSNAVSGDATGKAFVFISASVSPTSVNTKFRDVTVPVVCCENGIYDDMGMTGVPTSEHGSQTGQTQLTIANATHPMAAGLSGTVTVLTTARPFSWGKPGSSAAKVANLVSDATKWLIFGYETAAAMPGTPGTAPARRVGFFLEGATAQSLNSNGDSLFNAAVSWAAGGPASPTSLSVAYDAGAALLCWEPTPGAYSYIVKRSTSSNGPFTTIATGLTSNGYRDSSVAPDQTYFYIVIAVSSVGTSPPTAAIAFAAAATHTADVFGRTYLRRWYTGQTEAELWNTGTYTAVVKLGPGAIPVAGSGRFVASVPAELTVTRFDDYSAEVTTTAAATLGVKELTYILDLNAPFVPIVTMFKIRVDRLQTIQVFWRFPEVQGVTWGRTQRNATFFDDNDNIRLAAREVLTLAARKRLTFYLEQGILRKPANPPQPPDTHPNGGGWEQAGFDVYDTVDPTEGDTEPRNYFPATWFDAVSHHFKAGSEGAAGDADSEGIVEAQLLHSITSGVNVYFVQGIHYDRGGGLVGSARGWTIWSNGKDKRAIFISDEVSDADVGLTVAHELSHVLRLQHAEDLPAKQRVTFAQINNTRLIYSPPLETPEAYNITFGDGPGRKGYYLTNLQAQAANYAGTQHQSITIEP